MSFERYIIKREGNAFQELIQSVRFESFSKGRELAVLHRVENGQRSLVRTTTVYQQPSQPFTSTHETVIDQIWAVTGIPDLQLNNAMLEIYDSRYTKMGFHTDQALDLEADSHICLFSCYENGPDAHPRVLTVKNKESARYRKCN